MTTGFKVRVLSVVAGFIVFSTLTARAFSLLGPYEPWMVMTNGFRQHYFYTSQFDLQPADIGGPMDITNEYRWNVPLVTYGFDQSFLNYFGTNGMAAVESAIQILNDLPPASQILLTNYPSNAQQFNTNTATQNLVDLKSTTLSLLLEQMGLAQPTRYVYVLNGWNPSLFNYQPNGFYNAFDVSCFGFPPDFLESDYYNMDPGNHLTDFLVGRNFNPETLARSTFVNNTQVGAEVISGFWSNLGEVIQIVISIPTSFDAMTFTATADFPIDNAEFHSSLTADDVGGLRYLLSTNNVNYETLLPGVFGIGANANSFVNGAWRPGVDKITFVPQLLDALTGNFLPMTNQFTDAYITNGLLIQQQLARLVSKPDFLFSAKDFKDMLSRLDVSRTGTTNWINNAILNGNPSGAGPGVIQPPITITFNIAGKQYEHVIDDYVPDEFVYDVTFLWGTFDGSTNAPLVYPIIATSTNQMVVRMLLLESGSGSGPQQTFEWALSGSTVAAYNFQTSTNLSDWVTMFGVTNNGAICDFYNQPSSVQRFYRVFPQ